MGLVHHSFYVSSADLYTSELYVGEFVAPRDVVFSIASFWNTYLGSGEMSIRVITLDSSDNVTGDDTFTQDKAAHGTTSENWQRFQPDATIFLRSGDKAAVYIRSTDANDNSSRYCHIHLFDPTGSEFLDNETLIDGKTIAESLRYISAILAGKVSGAGTGTETLKGLDGTTDRVEVTVDAQGNRTAVSYDP